MILTNDIISELILSQTANGIAATTGIDSLEHCKDKTRFKTYHKEIIYHYNYMGYRDIEWPSNISQQYWAIGDSFTVGLGQPSNETWSNILSNRVGKRIINVSMNGASNDWIARRALYILKYLQPKVIFIQWSYLHRRELTDNTLLDEERAIWHSTDSINDIGNFIDNLKTVESNKDQTQIIHSFIPEFANPQSQDALIIFNIMHQINALMFPPCKQIDYSRDGHHYDVETANNYANGYFNILNQLKING